MMTVCRRTRASRQIFSRPLHSLGLAAEVTEAPSGWQEDAVLFSVSPEGLSILESHRTSQHSASLSDRCSPRSPETETKKKIQTHSCAVMTGVSVSWYHLSLVHANFVIDTLHRVIVMSDIISVRSALVKRINYLHAWSKIEA